MKIIITRKAQLEEALKTTIGISEYEGRTLWQETKARFLRNKAAIVGMVFVVFLLVLSVTTSPNVEQASGCYCLWQYLRYACEYG